MQMQHLCHANLLHITDEQIKCQLQQMPLNTTWKKEKPFINTYVQLQLTVNISIDLGGLFVWHRHEFAPSDEISLERAC